jgi:arylsulfatase A-like enzyme
MFKKINHLSKSVKQKINKRRFKFKAKKADFDFRKRDMPKVSPENACPNHILIIVVDAFRADYMGKDITNNLSNLSKTSAISPSTWTVPSVSSMMTGLYPHQHGAMRQSDNPDYFTRNKTKFPPKISDSTLTLPEIFAGAGYKTFSSFGFFVPFLALGGRFQEHHLSIGAELTDCTSLINKYSKWLQMNKNEKTFAYIHLPDLHAPVSPPEEYCKLYGVDMSIPGIKDWQFKINSSSDVSATEYRKHRKLLYQASLDYVDDEVGRLVKTQMPDLNDSITIVTSDHGEAFWENEDIDSNYFYDPRSANSVGHGATPYESVTRVPILSNDVQFEEPASLIDLFPTILNQCGIKSPHDVIGHDNDTRPPTDRVLLSEAVRHGYEKKAIYSGKWKRIISKGDDITLDFEIPDESEKDIPKNLEDRFATLLPNWPEGGSERNISQQTKDHLRDLGYVK